jgi:hypothetical protein
LSLGGAIAAFRNASDSGNAKNSRFRKISATLKGQDNNPAICTTGATIYVRGMPQKRRDSLRTVILRSRGET